MTELLLFRERLKELYGRFDLFIIPVLRFFLALITYTVINRNIGYMERLDSPTIVLAVSLVNAFLPVNAIVLFSGIFIVIHLYRLSLICAGVILVLFTLLFLLYFHFAPRDGIAVLITPVLCTLGFPYAIPLCFGLIGTVFSAIPIACGVIVYYAITYIKGNNNMLQDTDIEALSRELKTVIDGIAGNRNMRVMIVALGLSCLIVYLVHKLPVKYSWTIACCAGAVTELTVMLWGVLHYDLEVSVTGLFLGCILALILALLMQFFILSVDYTRTEYLQFQDDEYYYYVKAVPKMSISIPEKRVKKISGADDDEEREPARKTQTSAALREERETMRKTPSALREERDLARRAPSAVREEREPARKVPQRVVKKTPGTSRPVSAAQRAIKEKENR